MELKYREIKNVDLELKNEITEMITLEAFISKELQSYYSLLGGKLSRIEFINSTKKGLENDGYFTDEIIINYIKDLEKSKTTEVEKIIENITKMLNSIVKNPLEASKEEINEIKNLLLKIYNGKLREIKEFLYLNEHNIEINKERDQFAKKVFDILKQKELN